MSTETDESQLLFKYVFGDVEFDEARFELRVSGLIVEIQPKPLELLIQLLRAAGKIVSVESMLRHVWKFQNVNDLQTNVVGTALTKLRGALGKDAERVVNVPRQGYRFEGRVDRTAIGRRRDSGLSLNEGMSVPWRPSFILTEMLSRTKYSEVWRATHSKTHETRVYKFSPDGTRLAALRREATLYRVLNETLGPRCDIVRTIDWNFSDAPFFLECEDGGRNLRDWSQDHHRLEGLSIDERLSLFLQIADAVSAAHGVGVLHKDIKPDNVLVDGRGNGWQLRLTDFGSAYLLEPGILSELGITQHDLTTTRGIATNETTGTLLYLAPELTRGEPPSQQSDIYALGLLLYQLLVADLRLPLAPGWQRDIPDELLCKDIADATDGNPAHRTLSVEALSNNLRRLPQRRIDLDRNRRFEADAVAALEAVKKSRARRPLLQALFVVLGAAAIVCTVLAVSSHRAYLSADQERRRLSAVNGFLDDDLLGASDPTAPRGRHDSTVQTLLSRASDRLESRFRDDPRSKAEVNLALGKAYFGLSDYEHAEIFQRRAVEQLSSIEGVKDPSTLEAEYQLARTLASQAKYDEAKTLLDNADADAGKLLSENSMLAMLAASVRGGYFLEKMQPELALPQYERADQIRSSLAPADLRWRIRLGSALAWCYVRLGKDEEALRLLGDLVGPAYSIESVGAADWGRTHIQYAVALANRHQYPAAEASLRDTLSQIQSVLGGEHYYTASIWDHLGMVLQYQGRWEEASDALIRALNVVKQLNGPKAKYQQLSIETELTVTSYLSGSAEAEIKLAALHEQSRSTLGDSSSITQVAAFYLAASLIDHGRAAEAQTLLENLQPSALSAFYPGLDWSAHLAAARGLVMLGLGKDDTGRPMVLSALDRLDWEGEPSSIVTPLRDRLDSFGAHPDPSHRTAEVHSRLK